MTRCHKKLKTTKAIVVGLGFVCLFSFSSFLTCAEVSVDDFM